MALSREEKLRRCVGCRDNFYNRGPGNYCWSLPNARSREAMTVHIMQNPPYVWYPQKTLTCHRPQGNVWVELGDQRVVRSDKERIAWLNRNHQHKRLIPVDHKIVPRSAHHFLELSKYWDSKGDSVLSLESHLVALELADSE